MSGPSDRAETIVDAALDLTPAERQAYLDKACGDDVRLRQTVDALLRAHQHVLAPTMQITSLPPATGTEQPGDIIGPYKLLQRIGEGGCGVVYMAEQTSPVSRRVALKVIKPGMDTKQVIARFEAERQALALMDHPNIAKILEAGATETGRPYFVMELVRGIKITDYCDQNNLPTQPRLELFIQVCQAVQHAHQKGVIHRDLKPSNILVTLHDGVPVPKVIDFGIAKATAQRLTDKTVFTAFEQFIGTPAYMSPEQAEMSGLDIDTRSDIYSLGVLLYELLTSRIPFDAKELAVAGLDEMRRIIREQDPVRPSTKLSSLTAADQTTVARQRQLEAAKLIHLVRGDLDWIVMKCLEKDRTRRYETANGLAADVRRHLENEPVVACPPSTGYRFQKMVRRNKMVFVAGGAVIVALLLGLGFSTWALLSERRARAQTKSEAERSQQVAQILKDMLEGVGPSKAKGRDTQMLREILDKTIERLNKDLTNQPVVQAELLSTIGNVYVALSEFDKAEELHRAALNTRRALPRLDQDVAASLNNLANTLYWTGDLSGAERAAQEALAIQKKALRPGHPDLMFSLATLASVRALKGDFIEAVALQRQAAEVMRNEFGDESAKWATALDNLGSILSAKGAKDDLREAEKAHRKSLQIFKKTLGDQDVETISALRNLAMALYAQGQLEEAELRQHEAISSYYATSSRTNADLAVALGDLGAILIARGKLNEAETNICESIAISREVFGSNSVNVGNALSTLGVVLHDQKKFAEAEARFRESLVILENGFGKEAPYTLSARDNLAVILQRQGKAIDAEPFAREVFTIRERKWPDDWQTLNAKKTLASILMDQKRYSDAETLLIQSYEGLKLKEATLPPGGMANLTNACVMLVRLYKEWEKLNEAAEWSTRPEYPTTNSLSPK